MTNIYKKYFKYKILKLNKKKIGIQYIMLISL